MKTLINPSEDQLTDLLARPGIKTDDLEKIGRDIFAEVGKTGDAAVKKYTWYFDRVHLESLRVSPEEFDRADRMTGEELKEAIRQAAGHIEAFHNGQKMGKCEYLNEAGFRCWMEVRGIERVGLYIPGGSAPLFSSVLMLAIPARIAGCRRIVMCTPPDREGNVNPAILWAARYCGVTEIYKIGGMQAIAAMVFGTQTVPKVYKIFGPGNQYVTAAKQLALQYGVAIDMPAGPSEVMVVADGASRPGFVAADLLSQAEHGKDSQVILVTCCPEILPDVERELEKQLAVLPRREVAVAALQYAKFVVMPDVAGCIRVVNEYAPEHLILCVADYKKYIPDIQNAGSVFLGNYSPESAGDYASGTNHTLPTAAYAKAYSGINLDAFIKKIAFQEITPAGLKYLAPVIMTMAENEQLLAHKNAVKVRMEDK